MKMDTVNACVNCENLIRDFICQKHNRNVELDNICESHTYQNSITKDSSCSNCLHFKQSSCYKSGEASESMLCFGWQSK